VPNCLIWASSRFAHPCQGSMETLAGTFLGGVLHTLPFLIPAYRAALAVALATITFELAALAWIPWPFLAKVFFRSLVSIELGGQSSPPSAPRSARSADGAPLHL
jgi:hypothetical protein